MGRPSSYTPEIAAAICQRLEETGSLREVLQADDLPARSTVYAWEEQHEDFRTAIARAKRAGYDARAEQAVADAKAAKDASLGKLAFDADRWFLSKIDPSRFGDKLQLAGDGGGPMRMIAITADATPAEAAEAYQKMITGK